uniref:PmoA family protein n=1 Tax=Roseihalotalea indica TaxID=2867963 RepID=A0AA49JGP8_9BACT|nr:PmoA family protein [Tunicatimonas sp. TK19036]
MLVFNQLPKPAWCRLLGFALVLVQTNLLFAQVEIDEHPQEKSVSVTIDGQLFTSYTYPNTIKKPVLYPLKTPNGTVVTRGYPLTEVAGERVDHPHHVGLWLNYGDVNGLDFWNNSEAIPEEKREGYGTIRHREVLETQSGDKQGMLKVGADWMTPDQEKLLDETTTFYFSKQDNAYIIDRITTLKAEEQKVVFHDNKEGMIAIRVTRALELPSDKPEIFTDASGNPSDVAKLDNDGVNGEYISSEGITGNDVWGTQAEWVNLKSSIGDEQISIVIMDHPENVGYPTYWHARGYGLFSANPLGQEVFSDGKKQLNFTLQPQESVTLRYRIVVYGADEELSKEQIHSLYADFTDAS